MIIIIILKSQFFLNEKNYVHIYSTCAFTPTAGLHGEAFADLFGILLFMPNERGDYLIKSTWTGRQARVLVCCHFHWQKESRVINLSDQ